MLPLLLVLVANAAMAASYDDQYDPARLRDWARGSVDILATYRDYKEDFAERRPKRYDSLSGTLTDKERSFYFMFDGVATQPIVGSGTYLNNARIRTNEGPLEGNVQKAHGAWHASYRAMDWEAGGYAIMDYLELYFESDHNPLQGRLLEDVERLRILAGYSVVAAYFSRNGLGANAGLLVRSLPLTGVDSTGHEAFRLRRKSDSSYTGTETRVGIFLDLQKDGYSFNTLFSTREALESIRLDVPPLPAGSFTVAPFLAYHAFRTRVQAGAEIRRTFSWRSFASLEAAGDVHRNSAGRFEAFHHLVLGQSLALFALPPERLREYRRYDFKILLDGALSVSSDALDETAWGVFGGLVLQDMGGLVSARWGFGYNDYRHLRSMPVRDVLTVDLGLRLAW